MIAYLIAFTTWYFQLVIYFSFLMQHCIIKLNISFKVVILRDLFHSYWYRIYFYERIKTVILQHMLLECIYLFH